MIVKFGFRMQKKRDTADTWVMREPEQRPAQSWKIRNALFDIGTLKAKEFVSDPATDLSQYGLAKPWMTIRVWQEGKLLVELLLGKQKDNMVYVKTKDRDFVYRINQSSLERFALKWDDIVQEEEKEKT